ncbi:MAG: hypothetical protein KBS75_03925 [Bacteroidales bacterium]|nr:hypothetical protein [Candidatus Equimonas faecalis]
MKKKTYTIPCIEVVTTSPAFLLSVSDGQNIDIFNEKETDDLEEEYFQW